MKSELLYPGIFLGTLAVTIFSFLILLQQYTFLTLVHFSKTCYQALYVFFNSGYHLTGLGILTLTLITTIYFFLKVLFSTLKTQRKMRDFTKVRAQKMPAKLQQICSRHSIDSDLIFLVDKKMPLAFAIGFFAPRIVVTTGLLKLLSPAQVEAVILHELHHVKNRHGLLILGGQIITSTLSFFPFLKDVFLNMKASFEYGADAFVFKTQQTSVHVHAAIQKLLLQDTQELYLPAFSLSLAERRLLELAGPRTQASNYSLARVSFSILAVMILTALTFGARPSSLVQAQTITSSPLNCANNVECAVLCKGETLNSSIQTTFASFQNKNYSSEN